MLVRVVVVCAVSADEIFRWVVVLWRWQGVGSFCQTFLQISGDLA